MDRSIQITGGSFRQGLNSDVVTFSTTLTVQTSPLYKSKLVKKRKMAAPSFCILPSDWSSSVDNTVCYVHDYIV